MDDWITLGKLMVLPTLIGFVVGLIWRGRWLTMSIASIILGAATVLPQGDWTEFRDTWGYWNSSHFVWIVAIVVLSLVFPGGSSLVASILARSLKGKAKSRK